MNKRATIYDVAKAANTSIATVSRVLNSREDYPVKEELKKRVLKEAKRLKYTPNLIGRQLKNSNSNDIGVIIPNITNPFYPQLVLGVEHAALEKGFNVILCNSQRNVKTERKYLESLFQKQIKGIIISSISKNYDYLQQLRDNGVNIVAFEQNIELNCNKINFNYERGGCLAARHLVESGHKKIAFISAPLNKYSRIKVYEGFINYLKTHKINLEGNFILISEKEEEVYDDIYEYKNGKILTKKMIAKGDLPTAIFCINDITAFGVIQELQKNSIVIPDDISVIGFDNIPTSQMVTPSLTTIDQSTYEMGLMAAEVLINGLEDKKRKNISILLQPSLIVRDSTRELVN